MADSDHAPTPPQERLNLPRGDVAPPPDPAAEEKAARARKRLLARVISLYVAGVALVLVLLGGPLLLSVRLKAAAAVWRSGIEERQGVDIAVEKGPPLIHYRIAGPVVRWTGVTITQPEEQGARVEVPLIHLELNWQAAIALRFEEGTLVFYHPTGQLPPTSVLWPLDIAMPREWRVENQAEFQLSASEQDAEGPRAVAKFTEAELTFSEDGKSLVRLNTGFSIQAEAAPGLSIAGALQNEGGGHLLTFSQPAQLPLGAILGELLSHALGQPVEFPQWAPVEFTQAVETGTELQIGLDQVTLPQEFQLGAGQWSLTLEPGSHLALSGAYQYKATLVAAEDLTPEILARVDDALRRGGAIGDVSALRGILLAGLIREGKLQVRFRATGNWRDAAPPRLEVLDAADLTARRQEDAAKIDRILAEPGAIPPEKLGEALRDALK